MLAVIIIIVIGIILFVVVTPGWLTVFQASSATGNPVKDSSESPAFSRLTLVFFHSLSHRHPSFLWGGWSNHILRAYRSKIKARSNVFPL